MNEQTRSELGAAIRRAVKEHQQEGLNMIGGADQLVERLVSAVEAWLEEGQRSRQKTA
ncbi:MAG: hypothetical protein ACRD4F_02110 [Candidatus Angelobacter sp.]